jgi:hypothetical protein
MISTATAAVNAAPAPAPDADNDRHEHRGDPVRQPLHRRLARLGLRDQPGQLGQLGVPADPAGPDHQVAAGVHAPAGHRVARPDLGRGRLAGEHRGVDGRTARDHDSVRRDRLAGADGELIADG